MAKDISNELLNRILDQVGGAANIAKCGNCMTRLRLSVHDSSLVDPAIKTLEGVKGVVISNDQVQVIFGPGKAQRAADAMKVLLGETVTRRLRKSLRRTNVRLKRSRHPGFSNFCQCLPLFSLR